MEHKTKLESHTIWLMIGTALFFDALQTFIQAIPVAGQIFASILSVGVLLTFCIWFKLKGINFLTARRAALGIIGFAIEVIPLLNVLPTWTLAVGLICLDVKLKESKLGQVINMADYKNRKSDSKEGDRQDRMAA